MANTIKIKRGLSSNLDSLTLQEGELATTTDTRKLYIGNADGTKTELGQQGPQGVRGTKWWVGDFYSQMFDEANNGDLLLNTSEMSPGEVLQFYDGMWDPVANIRGPQGPQGEKGEPGESIPVGSIIPYGNSVVPETYLLCNGQAVSRTDYPELFAIIGTSFGPGDGSTTFNVPDYRDKFVLGAGGDVNLAETGGEKEVTLTVEQIPPHNHPLAIESGSSPKWGAKVQAGNTGNDNYAIGSTGGGQPHNNIPPYVGTYYLIKAKQSAGVIATVVDNLESTSAIDALSANMGKKLNDKISAQRITLVIGDSWTSTEEDSVNARDGANNWIYYFEPLQDELIYQKAEGGSGFVKTGVTSGQTFVTQLTNLLSDESISSKKEFIDKIIIYGGLNDIDGGFNEQQIKSSIDSINSIIQSNNLICDVYLAFFNQPKRSVTVDNIKLMNNICSHATELGWKTKKANGFNFSNQDNWASDNYHPNESGSKQIALCMMGFVYNKESIHIPIEAEGLLFTNSDIPTPTDTGGSISGYLFYDPLNARLFGDIVGGQLKTLHSIGINIEGKYLIPTNLDLYEAQDKYIPVNADVSSNALFLRGYAGSNEEKLTLWWNFANATNNVIEMKAVGTSIDIVFN